MRVGGCSWKKSMLEAKWLIELDGPIKWNCTVAANENEDKDDGVLKVNEVKRESKA